MINAARLQITGDPRVVNSRHDDKPRAVTLIENRLAKRVTVLVRHAQVSHYEVVVRVLNVSKSLGSVLGFVAYESLTKEAADE
jgi:hypothetical protein